MNILNIDPHSKDETNNIKPIRKETSVRAQETLYCLLKFKTYPIPERRNTIITPLGETKIDNKNRIKKNQNL